MHMMREGDRDGSRRGRIVTERDRLWTFALMLVSIAAMFLLAAGLPQLSLAPGQGLPATTRDESQEQAGPEIPGVEFMLSALRALFSLSILLFPAGIIYILVSPSARKRVIRDLGIALAFMVLFQVLGPRLAGMLRQNMPEIGSGRGAEPVDASALAADFVANPPAWLVWGTSLILAMAIIGIPTGLVAFLRWRRRQLTNPTSQRQELALEVQQAIDLLEAGANLRDVVVECYARMTRVLSETRGIERWAAMTPREFERRLRRAGLPNQPVHQLTQLFERARYGAKTAGPEEERRALDSLRAIVRACEASP